MRLRRFCALSVILAAEVASLNAQAVDYRPLYRSARQMAMGGTAVTTAEGDDALWLNPAGLARHQGFGFHIANGMVEAATDLYTAYLNNSGLLSNGGSLAGFANLIGSNPYGRAQITSTLMLGHLAIGFIVDQQTSIYTANLAYPQFTMGYQTTNGMQIGYGFQIPVRNQKVEWNVGAAAKYLARRGGYYLWGPLQILQFANAQALLNQTVGQFSTAIGFDIGTQYYYRISRKFKLGAGISYTDIGNTSFATPASPVLQNLSTGISAVYDTGPVGFGFAYDYRNIYDVDDWIKKSHLGLELFFPLVKLWMGLGGGYFSCGVGLDVGITRISGATYAEELGTYAGQNMNRRYMLSVDFKFD